MLTMLSNSNLGPRHVPLNYRAPATLDH